jgi:hypothetical protein
MNHGRLIFSQVTDILDPKQLSRCFARYPMPRPSRSFSASDQFLCMVFAQLTFREGLRDIEACLAGNSQCYGMGIRGNITRTNLAYANENRSWEVYAAVANILIRKAQRLYAADDNELDLKEMVYAIDSTTIDLCLEWFPWAHFRSTKSAIKVHSQMAITGSIPVFIRVSEGNVHDVNFLEHIAIEEGCIYVMDRGYLDYSRLERFASEGAFFVIRAKKNLHFHVRESRPVEKNRGLVCDQTIRLSGNVTKTKYKGKLRRIHFRDSETGKDLVFLTNHFAAPALTIARIYKARWRIELFFKWIKQNLRIKAFYGRSENAVKTQIWIAICTYLMVACLKKIHGIEQRLSRILQVISVNVFQKVHINQLLTDSFTNVDNGQISNQLDFNNLLTGH